MERDRLDHVRLVVLPVVCSGTFNKFGGNTPLRVQVLQDADLLPPLLSSELEHLQVMMPR